MENIGLQDSLLSRFDLLFIVLDKVRCICTSSDLVGKKSQTSYTHMCLNGGIQYFITIMILYCKFEKYCVSSIFAF